MKTENFYLSLEGVAHDPISAIEALEAEISKWETDEYSVSTYEHGPPSVYPMSLFNSSSGKSHHFKASQKITVCRKNVPF